MSAGRSILALNTGSSGLKFALFALDASLGLTLKGEIENLDATRRFVAHDASGVNSAETDGLGPNFAATLETWLNSVDQHLGEARLCAIETDEGAMIARHNLAVINQDPILPSVPDAPAS